ncbi:MAG TPA: amino acid permease [Candidatus Limnocylindria bacterium]|jgi:amino acid transporter|nr:amino acid permease [Candidatus Limnocylindria bacterium]
MTQSREQTIQQDVRDLHGLGYAQELLRSMGGFSNFAISFSIISILTGAVILYDYGLAWAGTAASLIGWPLITIFVLCIAAAMAEVASAYPTAGGLYYWASKMKNKNWGWWTAWLNLIGQFAIVAGINYAAALFINATIITPLTNGAYSNTTVFFGDPAFGAEGPALSGALVTMAVLLAVELALNIAGVRVVALLNQVSVWWHIFFVIVIAGALFFLGTKSTEVNAGLQLFAIQPVDTLGSWDNTFPVGSENPWFSFKYGPAVAYPLLLAFFFSLLQANWTYTGYDASAHVAEETIGARRASAWGIFLSVAVSAVAGYIFLLAITLHLPDLTPLFGQLDDPAVYSQYYFGDGAAVLYTLTENLGAGLGGVLGGAIAIAMAFCGLSSVASAGRMLFAFSRDGGVPGSGWLKKVSHRYRTPANSLTAMVIGAFILTFLAFWVGRGIAVVIVTAVSTIFLYAAYGVPIYLGLTTNEWRQKQVWSLGRWSRPIAIVSLFWIVVLMVLFSFPTSGNISWPFMVAIVLFLLVYYFGWARSRFMGPQAQGGEEQLSEIEREFEDAAKGLAPA